MKSGRTSRVRTGAIEGEKTGIHEEECRGWNMRMVGGRDNDTMQEVLRELAYSPH